MAISPLVDTWFTLGQDVPQVEFRNWGRSLESHLAVVGGANLLINGDFQINQRGFAGGALAAGNSGFDRWRGYGPGASAFSRSGYVVTLNGRIGQAVEPAVMAGVASLASTPITVSIENPSGSVVVIAGSASGTITAGSGWRSITLTTAAGDTGNVVIALDTSVSTTFCRVKAEVGTVATPWAALPADLETLLCQRYFSKSMRLSVPPANGANYAHDSVFGIGGHVAGGTLYGPFVVLPSRMRASPTITLYRTDLGAVAGRWQYLDPSAGWLDGGVPGVPAASETGFLVQFSVSGLVTQGAYGVAGAWTASAEL